MRSTGRSVLSKGQRTVMLRSRPLTNEQLRGGPPGLAGCSRGCYGQQPETMDFRILGPLEVRDDRGGLSLGGGKQRALLALLLIHPNESLSTDLLIDELWPEQPPPTVAKILQNYVSQLRRVLGDDR